MLQLRYKRPLLDTDKRPWTLRIPTTGEQLFCDIQVTWGDGTTESITSVEHLCWLVPDTLEEFIITLEGEIPSLTFGSQWSDPKSSSWLYEIDGILPRLSTGRNLFEGCENLSRVLNPDFFQENSHWENVSGCFANCRSYIPNWNLWKPLTNIRIADELHKNNQCLYEVPAHWCSTWNSLLSANATFSMCGSLLTVHPDCFRTNTELHTVDYCFAYCPNLRHIGVFFDSHPHLVRATYLFYRDQNLMPVDKNYRSYFLHPDIVLEGIFRETRVEVFLFENEY